jgi:hypothetical protein
MLRSLVFYATEPTVFHSKTLGTNSARGPCAIGRYAASVKLKAAEDRPCNQARAMRAAVPTAR